MAKRTAKSLFVVGLIAAGQGISAHSGEVQALPTPAERIARALVQGEAHSDRRTRTTAIGVLEGLGARPADKDAIDFAHQWSPVVGRREAAASPFRGRILGPAYRRGTVAVGEIAVTDQLFTGGQSANIAIAPTAGAKLSLAVRDGNGAIHCQKPIKTHAGTCQWIPLYSQRYHIEISNIGTGVASYFLVVD